MANIELRERFSGGGFVGQIGSQPALSWSEHQALVATAGATWLTAEETTRARRAVESLGDELGDVADAIATLEGELGLHLEQQTQVLVRQLDLLADVAVSLRTPAKTRAAERIVDAGELLRRGRHSRALAVAQQAIDDDPNNPAGFRAAAWALQALGRLSEAHAMYVEAAAASDGDDQSEALRQAARLAYAEEGASRALRELQATPSDVGRLERAAVDYDLAVYYLDSGDEGRAVACLRRAGSVVGAHCQRALVDPVLARNDEVARAAFEQLKLTRAEVEANVARRA